MKARGCLIAIGVVLALVDVTGLGGIGGGGAEPAGGGGAAQEIDRAAARGGGGPVRPRLQQVAAGLRSHSPAAPPGIPEEVHRLLLLRVAEIEAQPRGHVATRLPRLRAEPETPAPATSP